MVYSDRDYDLANKVLEMMQSAQGRFGIRVEDP